jgi:hypothetical protein
VVQCVVDRDAAASLCVCANDATDESRRYMPRSAEHSLGGSSGVTLFIQKTTATYISIGYYYNITLYPGFLFAAQISEHIGQAERTFPGETAS